MTHEVNLTRGAARQLARIEAAQRPKLTSAIEGLSATPRPRGCKKLVGVLGRYRIRVGNFRILYEVQDSPEAPTVLVVWVGDRRDAY